MLTGRKLDRELEQARIDGRLAILPEHVRPGASVWFWDSVDCREEACDDMVSPRCASNQGLGGESVARCQLCHPVLRHVDVWSVYALFGAVADPLWVINETYTFSNTTLELRIFADRESAQARRPKTLPPR